MPRIHRTRPLTVETARRDLGGDRTPTGRMFVRQNLDLPDSSILAERDRWTVQVAGVERPRPVSLAELRRLPTVERRVVLECAGNARTLGGRSPAGETPWGAGAVACADWTGVAVGDVLARLGGAAAGARYLTALGGDGVGRGGDPGPARVERSIPLGKALDDALLAWSLNGAPLPLEHGGPLRLVVPGYYAVNSVKFLRRLACTAEQSDADIQRTRYRFCPPGEAPGPHQASLWALRPKSLILEPWGAVTAGRVEVTGIAWSGEAPVERVELTLDDGVSWRRAPLEPSADPAAWRRFSCLLEVPPGRHRLASRATDARGAVQPPDTVPDANGYATNGWRGLGIDLLATVGS